MHPFHLILGTRQGWDTPAPFGLGRDDLRRHLYVVGQTGAGKTTLLRNLIVQHLAAGHGVGLIDPHGDLAEELLFCVPGTERILQQPGKDCRPPPFSRTEPRGQGRVAGPPPAEIQKVRDEMARTHRLYLEGHITSRGFGEFYKPAENRLNQLNQELPNSKARWTTCGSTGFPPTRF